MALEPGITAALIVRNNADTLDRCFASIKRDVKRIAVVDTGSTDATIDIAKKYGAEIEHFTWINDFAAARNVSLEMVRTEWTMWLDSDEWFEPLEAAKLPMAIETRDAAGLELIRRNHMPRGVIGKQAMVRLWRTAPGLRMVGQIHEHIPIDGYEQAWPTMKVFRTNISFEHDGFINDDEVKPNRNLPLLEAEVAKDPKNLYMLAEMYLTYNRLGQKEDVDRTIRMAMEALKDCDPNHRQPGFSASHLIKILLLRGQDVERFALGWYWDVPDVMLAVAQAAIQRNDLPRAFQILTGLEELRLSGKWNPYIPMDEPMIEKALATNLALVAHQLGHEPIARAQYLRLLQLDPGNEVATNNMRLL